VRENFEWEAEMSDFRLPRIPHIDPVYVQEAERFQKGLAVLYDSMVPGLKPDEEIAIFFETGKETIRVTHLKMASDSVLILTGRDENGNGSAVAGHFKGMHLIYKKLKLGETKQRIPIGFSTAVDE
jgi:hypothetical protein